MKSSAFGSQHQALALNLGERSRAFETAILADSDSGDTADSDGTIERKIRHWRLLFPFLGADLVDNVASVHRIDPATIAQLFARPLGPTEFIRDTPWSDELQKGFQAKALPRSTMDRSADFADLLGLAEPWIAIARRRLAVGVTDTIGRTGYKPCDPALFVDLACAALPALLLPRIGRTLILELNVRRSRQLLDGTSTEARFRQFCAQIAADSHRAEILQRYPVLARILVESLETWVDASLEFLARLCRDWGDITSAFAKQQPVGTVEALNWHQGDFHRGGRAVVHVRTTSGLQFVYKPRDLSVEVHFQELVVWLNDHGQHPRLKPLRVLPRGNYGWTEFVEHAACNSIVELEAFYERQGAYLALLYLLNATDIHFDNLIACGEHPFVVDLETVFHPYLEKRHPGGDPASEALRESVLRVGMLPTRSFAAGYESGVDISAVGGAGGQRSPFAMPIWRGIATDEMQLLEDHPLIIERKNRPLLDGAFTDAAPFAEAFLKGFRSAYAIAARNKEALLAETGPISRFAEDETRVVFRPTLMYATLRQASYHPDVLTDAADRDALFGWLCATAGEDAQLQRITFFEMQDLRAGDIPLFSGSPTSRDIRAGPAQTLHAILGEPAMESVRRQLKALGDKDLNLQSWLIRAAFASMAPTGKPRERTPIDKSATCDRAALIEEARQIGDRIARAALHNADGSASWLCVNPAPRGRSPIAPAGMALYDGLPGIALFLGYLGHVTGERGHKHLARQALRTVRAYHDTVRACGAFDGTAGIAYALAHLGCLWDDRSLVEEGARLACVTADRAVEQPMFDVISGVAGCIKVLLTLNAIAPRDALVAKAAMLGDHLVRNAVSQAGGVAWDSLISASRPLTGFGHGTAGIGWALFELFRHTGKDAHRITAADAFAYEQQLYDPTQYNWPDFRKSDDAGDQRFGLSWCHGAPGILLSRLRALACGAGIDTVYGIEEPLAQLGGSFRWGHGLCHGDLGNLEVLREAFHVLGDRRWHMEYAKQLSRAVLSGRTNGWILDGPEGFASPGLMTGMAGIGYGLLRAVAPEKIPSLLILAAPCEGH